jgi:hypothetical protein
MKKQFPLILSAILMIATQAVQSQIYKDGVALTDATAISVHDLKKVILDKSGANIKLKGEIVEVCQNKGCWMTVATGANQTIRITFKDYGFFVPKDVAGKTTTFEGELKLETVDVATLRHYAEDAGKSKEEIAAITEPETNYTFVAVGVEIQE